MNMVLNLGTPRKSVAELCAGHGESRGSTLKITGLEWTQIGDVIVTSPAYGAGMTLDALNEFAFAGLLRPKDSIVFIGSMGSLCADIELGDVTIPEPCVCAYYGFQSAELHQNVALRNVFTATLSSKSPPPKMYKHGSSFAVFDPHTDHKTYRSSLYDRTVKGVDCGEVFVGLEFAEKHDLTAAAVLYCSDSPTHHIGDVGEAEFNRRARQFDQELNSIALRLLAI